MIEKRLVQWYASDAGVDLDIAEREIVLTYVLRILFDQGLLDSLAFKGGTAIRKLYLGSTGRFSLDLNFTAVGDVTPGRVVYPHADRGQSGLDFALDKRSGGVAEQEGAEALGDSIA
jgi:predicted nucleotidyltransferase component of viral defense system